MGGRPSGEWSRFPARPGRRVSVRPPRRPRGLGDGAVDRGLVEDQTDDAGVGLQRDLLQPGEQARRIHLSRRLRTVVADRSCPRSPRRSSRSAGSAVACRRRSGRRPGDDDNPAGEPDRTTAWPAPTPSSRALSRTQPGPAGRSPTSSDLCCASTTLPLSRSSNPGSTASVGPRLTSSSSRT